MRAQGRGAKQQVITFWSHKKVGTERVLRQTKNDSGKFEVANVIIGLDMKFEKGFNTVLRIVK